MAVGFWNMRVSGGGDEWKQPSLRKDEEAEGDDETMDDEMGVQQEILARPQQWANIEEHTQFYQLPQSSMNEDEVFPSLSDFEDVTYFNQPYLAQYGGQQNNYQQAQHQQHQQHQQYQQHQEQYQQPFPSLLTSAEESQPAFGLHTYVPDEAIEPLLFQQMPGAETFEQAAFQPTSFEPTAAEPVIYGPATIEPTMFQQPTGLEHAFVPSNVEPAEFNFNTLPHGGMQQPILGESWGMTHDGGLFEPAPDEYIKREASTEESSHIPQMSETTSQVQNPQNPAHYEPTGPGRVPVRAPRRLLPSNGHRQRPVHRQPEVRARRLPVLQLSSQAGSERAAKDLFLVQSRRQNISYRDIKRLGNFTEAESTLRGRYRTLTKEKKDRVRDPKWTEIDIHLLKEAVRVIGHGLHPDRAKISWMAVSRYISNHGGSYGFGYSTCHRRWSHLEATGQLDETGYDDSWVDDDDDAETLAEVEEELEERAEEDEDEDEESEESDEEDEGADIGDKDYEESEDAKDDCQMAEKDPKHESQSEEESNSSSSSDDDNGVPIKTEIKSEE
ncbi:hypothetical protein TrVFT333_004822 [Trichoderma virens FT-333]|nr:hypothetical protein TrVFT333_004822 [Trichoderma virens FT-333]